MRLDNGQTHLKKSGVNMSKLSRENLFYMLLSTVLVLGGYWFLRYAYQVADEAPFS